MSTSVLNGRAESMYRSLLTGKSGPLPRGGISHKPIQLTDYNITLQAALDGQGIAIGRVLLIPDHLRTGRLLRPLPQMITSTRTAHWLATQKDSRIAPAVQTFIDWLVAEIEAAASQTVTGPYYIAMSLAVENK